MAPRTIYANLSAGLQPFTLFDQSLADMGSLGAIPCLASGTNTIVLTPLTNAFGPTPAYSNKNLFSFIAAGTSSTAVTVNVNALGALPLYQADGITQFTSGLIVNALYVIGYSATFNGGGGGFQILSATLSTVSSEPIVVTTGSGSVAAGDPAVAVNRVAPASTAISLPTVASRNGRSLVVVDWSTSVTAHTITLTPNGSETIMRTATFDVYSNTSSLGSVILYPSIVLNGWYV